MTVEFGFDVVGTYPVSLEINEEDLPENWSDMTAAEQNKWLMQNYEDEMFHEASWDVIFQLVNWNTLKLMKKYNGAVDKINSI